MKIAQNQFGLTDFGLVFLSFHLYKSEFIL